MHIGQDPSGEMSIDEIKARFEYLKAFRAQLHHDTIEAIEYAEAGLAKIRDARERSATAQMIHAEVMKDKAAQDALAQYVYEGRSNAKIALFAVALLLGGWWMYRKG